MWYSIGKLQDTNMHIKQQDRRKKIITTTVAAAAVILLAGGVYYYLVTVPGQKDGNSSTGTDTPAKHTDTSKTAETKNSAALESPQPSATEDKPQTVANEPSERAIGSSLTITTLSQENTIIKIKVAVTNTDKGGRCIAYFTSKNNDAVSTYLQVQVDGSGVICTGELPATNFSYVGTWTARIAYTTPDSKLVESSKSLEIR